MRTVVLDEYQTFQASGLSPNEADLDAATAPEIAKRIKLRWMRRGTLEITTGQYIGVVDLNCVSIQVRPKLVGRELAVLQMIDYASGLRSLQELTLLQRLGSGLHLRDLVCLLLTRECDRLLRHGLRRDYLRRDEALPVVRGRLLADRQVVRRYGLLDRLECRFDELSSDIPDNRLCSAALELAARTAHDPGVRARARRLAADFAAACPAGRLDAQAVAERLVYHRANEHYRDAHRWALMLLGQNAFGDLYAPSGAAARTFMIDMNRLFEAFTTQLLRDAFHGTECHVRAQEPLRRAVVTEDGSPYSPITPDMQLVRGHGPGAWRCSIDAKYKLYGDKKISSSDIFQSVAYAQALSHATGSGVPTSVVLYASDRDVISQAVVLRRRDQSAVARVLPVAVNVPDVLGALAADERPALFTELRSMASMIESGILGGGGGSGS